ncbi:M23 family metallopeptidase [Pedobacter panaciterrae]|uniref:M23 family metallopeptidase n=1 Tax=Pedobacter panaciterrae TaxID=363849 RepID=UPI00155DB1CC|nr:M23 family metallopeptidase [Pedobacter panaciterrae]NQX55033.1 M23 family metallopeptidase [Pedobacter panaciterrae]
MARKKDRTTIIFVNNNQNSNKPIQVPSSYILHWKKYVFGLLGTFVFLLGMIIYLSYNMTLVESSKELLSKQLRENKKEATVLDTSALKKHYESIDKKLLTINKFLKARGIKTIVKNEGGEGNSDILSVEEIGEFYEGYLNKMIDYVAFTPMGYPHFGAITSGYGHRENPFIGENVETHKGLDFGGKRGEIVKSTASGRVTYAGRRGGYGNCIVINHGNGFETYYGHLSRILITEGTQVKAGDNIGKIGSTGRSTGPHLHYEIHKNGKIINPRSFLTIE